MSTPDPNIIYDTETGFYYFFCPKCGIQIQVQQAEICCKMFVCGSIDGNPVNPHTSKEEAERIRNQIPSDKLVGCLSPFYFDGKSLSLRNYG